MKFEEHDSILFRMLDKSEPLTPDAEMPCLVRLIQDDSPMGLCNRWKYSEKQDFLKKDWTISSLENNLNKVKDIHYSQFEIIGYPVAEGSAEWALYQMMQGKWVYNPSLEKHKSDKLDTRYLHAYGKFGQDIVVKNTLTGIDSILGAANISHWTNYAEPSGWQLYEPKPKPLLADAKVGDLCKRMDGKWVQIETLCSLGGMPWICYEIGGLRYINNGEQLNTKDRNLDIIDYCPLAPEGSAEWAWQMAKLGIETKCIYGKIRISDSGMIEVCYNGLAYALTLKQSAENRKYIINKIRECSTDGWQIYEPAPVEQPEPIFKVGDWVEWCGDQYMVESAPPQSGGRYDIRSPYDELGCSVCPENITRKLSPSEVIVHIGCLRGTVKRWDSTTFHMFHGNSKFSKIHIDALDKETRKLVEGLLEAQEEK